MRRPMACFMERTTCRLEGVPSLVKPERTFFTSRETGGTVVSSALNLTADILRERYPSESWNI